MPAFLLIFCLILNSSNSCAGRFNKNTYRASSQSGVMYITPLLEQVDSCDEPTLRVFLRLKIVAYLWSNSSGFPKPESVVMAALADLRAHEKEIPALYVNLFRRDLIAQLKAHAPDAAARLTEEDKLDRRTDLEVAYSLLGQENGVDKAVSIVQRSIANGNDPGRIIVSFLHRLETVKPTEVPKLLNTVMVEEESHPGSISTSTLFTLKHLFLRQQTSQDLQRRYFVAVINRAGEKDASLASVVDTYTILADVLPVVEKQTPDLYGAVSARLSELTERVPRGTLERISIDKRVSQSSDPLAQLMTEENAATDPSLKEDLQIRAAQLALERGQIRTAIDLAVKLQPKNEESSQWRDQFIEESVEGAINKSDVEAAQYAASQIHSASIRSSALRKIALYFQTSNDLVSARNTLNSALKLAEASDDGADKAVELLDLAVSFLKVDNHQSLKLLRAAIKIINKTPAVMQEAEVGSAARLGDVEKMMKITYRIIPTFQALSAADESLALDLAKDIQRQEIRIAATLGAYTSPPAMDKNRQGVASK